MKITRKKLGEIWEQHSYLSEPKAMNFRRMTDFGFLEAIQKLGVKIREEPNHLGQKKEFT